GHPVQFSMASSGPSSPPQRSTHKRYPRSSKYSSKNSRRAAGLARSSSRSSSAHAGGDIGVSMDRAGSAARAVVATMKQKHDRNARSRKFGANRGLRELAERISFRRMTRIMEGVPG